MKLQIADNLDKKLSDEVKKEFQLQFDNRISETVNDLKVVTPKDTGYAASRWTSYKSNEFKVSFSLQNKFFIKLTNPIYIIENDADYIQFLNAGWSKQAPPFFVEQTLLKNGFVPT